jgi:hypothetical protein
MLTLSVGFMGLRGLSGLPNENINTKILGGIYCLQTSTKYTDFMEMLICTICFY